jgi:hypothetical protein
MQPLPPTTMSSLAYGVRGPMGGKAAIRKPCCRSQRTLLAHLGEGRHCSLGSPSRDEVVESALGGVKCGLGGGWFSP